MEINPKLRDKIRTSITDNRPNQTWGRIS